MDPNGPFGRPGLGRVVFFWTMSKEGERVVLDHFHERLQKRVPCNLQCTQWLCHSRAYIAAIWGPCRLHWRSQLPLKAHVFQIFRGFGGWWWEGGGGGWVCGRQAAGTSCPGPSCRRPPPPGTPSQSQPTSKYKPSILRYKIEYVHKCKYDLTQFWTKPC